MNVFAKETEQFVAELDTAIAAHLDWTRRVLRCAVLRSTPGEDVLAPDAHALCHFGRWFHSQHEVFERLDSEATARVAVEHTRMHDAVRAICQGVLAGEGGQAREADVDAFEAAQTALVADLARLKTTVLAHSARCDALTGLPLRYGLEQEFERSQALTRRNGQLLVLVLADIDHFKRVNDTHGHAVGDLALCHVAALLKRHARAGEPVFRFGGEEFLMLLHAFDRSAAEAAVQRLLGALRSTPLVLAGSAGIGLTLSAGLAQAGADESMADAVERADQALFAAKRQGRDRCEWAPQP